MIVKAYRPPPQLKGEKVYSFQASSRLRIRCGFYRQRVALLPGAEINWEEGFLTFWCVFLLWWFALEYEFNPDYDKSDQVVEGLSEMHWIEHQRRADLEAERTFWMNVYLSQCEECSVLDSCREADQALFAYKERFQ